MHVIYYGWMLGLLLISNTSNLNAQDAKVVLQQKFSPIDTRLFQDSISHWQRKHGRDRNDERYREDQIIQIADNILQYQNPDGGWATNIDWLAKINYEEVKNILGRTIHRSTFDNRSTYPQIEYLSKVYTQTKLERFRKSALRGLNYIFNEQRPSGGWRGKDVDAVTYNDDVMIGIMTLLYDITQQKPHYDWINGKLRAQVKSTLNRAIDVTLKCQIEVNGIKTAWCQQHSHTTFKPVKARTYELPSITAGESVGVVRFLMQIEKPSEEIIESIENAVEWLERSKIEGIRIKNVRIDPVRFENFTATFDRIVVEDKNSSPLWARFYEVDSNRPFFCNRDGTKVYSLAEVQLERRVGYGWYTGSPTRLLENDYPIWKKRITSQ